ncbi:MAG TPA: hypothetical protein VJ739_03780, partial [Gemmataceae bacterium]|nr:hypothetical protein [Gemmataceae bacterium]
MATGPRLELGALRRSLRAAWKRLRRWAALPGDGPDPARRFAPLWRLEDRRLLSVTPLGTEFRVNSTTANN